MDPTNPNVRFTYDDYKSLPERMDKRYELLDGELLMVPAPSTAHQRVSRNVAFMLLQFVRAHQLGEVLYAPIDVVLGSGERREVVQPDVLFVSRANGKILSEQEIQGAPDLIAEVLSPGTEQRDRGYKKVLYSRYGVKEYWIIDLKQRTMEVLTPGTHGFEVDARYTSGETATSPLLPGLQFNMADIFRKD